MEEAGAMPHETVMIGDSEVDVMTARNAGVWSIGCTFGLAPQTLVDTKPDVSVDEPREWTEVLSPVRIDLRR
jgi:phosphoglycolate phosphatase